MFVLFALYATAGVASALCVANTDCQSCAEDETGCGWCPSTSQCLAEGSGYTCPETPENGPFTNDASLCKCIHPIKETSCTTCESTISTCNNGWCPSTGKCLYGGSSGPAEPASCPATPENASWVWGSEYCKCTNPLTTATDCTTCESTISTCNNGWCNSTGKCMFGNSGGPLAPLYCPGRQWAWGSSTCRL